MGTKDIYGKTSWGKAFLSALQRLDSDGRIQRGKTIANTGKVLEFRIRDNNVAARGANCSLTASEMFSTT